MAAATSGAEAPSPRPTLSWPPWPWPPPSDSLPASLHVAPGAAGGKGQPFANHDCRGLESPVLDWDELRKLLQTECGHTRLTRTLRCAAKIPHWEELVLPFLRLRLPPQVPDEDTEVEKLEVTLNFHEFDRIEAAAYSECPLGVLILNIARTMLCTAARDVLCYVNHGGRVSRELYKTPLSVMMGTEWPIFAMLNSYDWRSWPGIPAGQDYDCARGNRNTSDWPSFRDIYIEDPERPDATWWADSLRHVFDPRLAKNLYTGSRECLYGVYVMNIGKAMWAADTESSSYRIYSPYISYVMYESIHLLGATIWPIFALLHHFQSLRRHGFRLDFSARELGGLPLRAHGAWLQAMPIDKHMENLEFFSSWRPHFASVVRAFVAALGHTKAMLAPRFVYVTMVYGRFNKYIAGWSRRLQKLGVENMVMATLDAEAHDLCNHYYGGNRCVTGAISVLNKFTMLLIALQIGIDVMWLDFDIFLVQNPGAAIVEALDPPNGGGPYDILMGYDFTSDCICNGYFYLRSKPIVHRWLFELVRWLYDHPFEHDQRAISAFLNYTERISATPEELPPLPRWHVFDADNTMINWGSWEGRSNSDLVLVHFVDGSAFTLYGRPLWDASIPQSKLDQLDAEQKTALGGPADVKSTAMHPRRDATSGVTPGAGASGKRIAESSPMDAFYESEVIDASPEVFTSAEPMPGLSHTLSRIRHLLDSQKLPKPKLRQRCGILPAVRSAHDGYGWLSMPDLLPPWGNEPLRTEEDPPWIEATSGFGLEI